MGVTTLRLQSWAERQLLGLSPGAADQRSYTFAEIVCLKAAHGLDERGTSDKSIQTLLQILHERISEMDERLPDRTVAVFEDRIVITRKSQFVDSRADRSLVRFGLNELIERAIACAVEKSPARTADEWFEEGRKHSRSGDSIRLALAAFRESVRVDSTHTDAYLEMGRIYLREGQLLEAERSLRLALRRDPYRRDTHYLLGQVMEGQQCLEEAISFYEKALDADPSFANAHYRLGRVCAQTEQWDRALKHLARCLALNPRNARADVIKRQIEEVEKQVALTLPE